MTGFWCKVNPIPFHFVKPLRSPSYLGSTIDPDRHPNTPARSLLQTQRQERESSVTQSPKYYREDLKINMIYDNTTNVQLQLIAKALIK